MTVVLPRYVVFKGDNNKYLKRYHDWGQQHLQFSTDEIGDVHAATEIFPVANGNIRIKSLDNNCFWRAAGDEYVYVDSSDTSSNDRSTLFRPIQLDDHTIVLQNVGNNNFCKRFSEGSRKPDLLRAYLSTVDKYSKLKVEEPVLSREIYDIKYDVDNATIYGDTIVAVGENVLTNHTDEPASMRSEISYEHIMIATWKASFSLKSTVVATARAGIPLIAEGKVEVTNEMQAGIEWGKTEIKKDTKTDGVTTTVPPKSKGTITLVATRGSCDLPFTYKQKDTLYNGSTVIHEYRGIFTGTNYYGTYFEIPEFEPL